MYSNDFIFQQCLLYQQSDTNYDLIKLYAASHTDRNGEWTHPDAPENYVSFITCLN